MKALRYNQSFSKISFQWRGAGGDIFLSFIYFACSDLGLVSVNNQGQLLEGVECHIYLYCFTFDDINLNRAFVIIVLFPKKYGNKKVCANDIRK